MNATEEKAQQINDVGGGHLVSLDPSGRERDRNILKSDAPLTRPRSPGVPWGYTYFIRRSGAIKIGHSGFPKGRIMALQVAFPEPLEVLAVIPNSIIDEPTAHHKFVHLRMRGEWFRAAPELLYFISQVKAEADKMPKRKIPNLSKISELDRLRFQLSRMKPFYSPKAQACISVLFTQLRNFPDNPAGLRPLILENIKRIEAAG